MSGARGDSSSLNARARPVAESALPVRGSVRRWSGGGWLVSGVADEVLVLDRELRVATRFPVPAELPPRLASPRFPRPGDYQVDVSPDGQWAVFAGTDRTLVADADGNVAWRIAHAALRSVDGDPTPTAAVFLPDGTALWAFVPDANAEDGDGWPVRAERHVVTRSGWQTTGRIASGYGGGDLVVHPDGRRLGFATFDGSEFAGSWVGCDDGTETSLVTGDWLPLGTSPEGARWVGRTWQVPVVGDYDGAVTDPSEEAMDDDDAWDYEADEEWEEDADDWMCSTACFLTSDVVLAASRGEVRRHVLYHAETLGHLGQIAYPPGYEDEQDRAYVGSDGDGTWVTLDVAGGNSSEQRLRRWTCDLVSP